MSASRSRVQVARAALLAKANAARAVVVELRAAGVGEPGLRGARTAEAAAWSAYRRAVRG